MPRLPRLTTENLEDRATPSTFTVINTNDDANPGSLRWAIEQANAAAGTDDIVFAILGSGVQTIAIGSALPRLTGDVTVDGYTQSGASPNTLAVGDDARILIEIDGGGTQAAFLTNPGAVLTGTTIRGLSLVNFAGGAITFDSSATVSNTVIEGNFIGVRPDGATRRANATGILFDNPHGTGNHRIGGTAPAQRNVISGNTNDGIYLNTAAATVQGNYVGTDASGTIGLPNGLDGVELRQSGNLIGGTVAGAANVISGNGRDGIDLAPGTAANNTVQGNLIGLAATGTAAVGNTQYGVHVANAGGANLIGGDTAAARNVISGNGAGGVLVETNVGNQEFRGNYVGTDAAGAVAIPNSGVGIDSRGNNLFVGNVVSGNVLDGFALANVNTLQGNTVGADATGLHPLPNGRDGVSTQGPALIGGTSAGQGNLIAFNSRTGVQVIFPAVGARVLGNSIHSNGGLGIALVSGGNADQPAPALASAVSTTGGVQVAGTLTTAPGVYRVEVFANAAGDPSGSGEGQAFLGFATVTVGAGGSASFTADVAAVPAGLGSPGFVSATATSQGTNNTSAFSNARPIATAPPGGSVGRPRVLSVGGSATGTASVYVPNAAGQYANPPVATTPAAVLPGFAGEVRTASGDFNGDGVEDTVLVTGPGTKTVMAVVNGKDGLVLVPATDPFGDANFTFGGFVASGDIDRDGRWEWVVTPELRGGPRVIIFHLLADGSFDITSASQPSLVANFFGIGDPNFRDGDRAALGDVNADGTLDVFSIAAFNGGPRTALYDGKDVLVARAAGRDPVKLTGDFFVAPSGQDEGRGGRSIAVGDVNGDGRADLIATGDNLLGTGNQIVVFSGADLVAGRFPGFGATPLANYAVGGQSPTVLVSVATVNADGDDKADMAVGSGAGQASLVKAYLGKDIFGTTEPASTSFDPFGGITLNGVFVG